MVLFLSSPNISYSSSILSRALAYFSRIELVDFYFMFYRVSDLIAICLFSAIRVFVKLLASVNYIFSFWFYSDNPSSLYWTSFTIFFCSFIPFYINFILRVCSFLLSLSLLFSFFSSSILFSISSYLFTLFFISYS